MNAILVYRDTMLRRIYIEKQGEAEWCSDIYSSAKNITEILAKKTEKYLEKRSFEFGGVVC